MSSSPEASMSKSIMNRGFSSLTSIPIRMESLSVIDQLQVIRHECPTNHDTRKLHPYSCYQIIIIRNRTFPLPKQYEIISTASTTLSNGPFHHHRAWFSLLHERLCMGKHHIPGCLHLGKCNGPIRDKPAA